MSAADVRRLWPEVLTKVQNLRRLAWVILSQNSQVVGVDGNTLTIGLPNAGARESFDKNKVSESLTQALNEVVGGTWLIETVVDVTSGQSKAAPQPAAAPAAPTSPPQPAADPAMVQQIRDRLNAEPEPERDPDADVSADDPVTDDGTTDPIDLLSRELGAEIIDETSHD